MVTDLLPGLQALFSWVLAVLWAETSHEGYETLPTGKGSKVPCWGTRVSRNGGSGTRKQTGGKEGVLWYRMSTHSSRNSCWWQWRAICLLNVTHRDAEVTGRGWWSLSVLRTPHSCEREYGICSEEKVFRKCLLPRRTSSLPCAQPSLFSEPTQAD